MNEEHDMHIHGLRSQFSAPENWCRAIFLQIAIRVKKRRAGIAGRELARFFSEQAEAAFEGAQGFSLHAVHPDGPDFSHPEKEHLLIEAAEEVVRSIEASATAPENWNACPRWRDWGIVKARELVEFLQTEQQPVLPGLG